MEILKLWKESLISMPVLKSTETIPIITAGWLLVLYLVMTSHIMIQTNSLTCRVVSSDLTSHLIQPQITDLQAPSTPCLALLLPPCPRPKRPGSMQINYQTITLNFPRNLYQVFDRVPPSCISKAV